MSRTGKHSIVLCYAIARFGAFWNIILGSGADLDVYRNTNFTNQKEQHAAFEQGSHARRDPRRVARGTWVHSLQEHAHLAKTIILDGSKRRAKDPNSRDGGTNWGCDTGTGFNPLAVGFVSPCGLRSIPSCWPDIWYVPVRLSFQGGTRVWSDEPAVRVCETAPPRTEEECQPAVCCMRAGESVLYAEKTVAAHTGLSRKRRLQLTYEPPKRRKTAKERNPNACGGLAEHLLPRRKGLIQSFPRESLRGPRSSTYFLGWTGLQQ